MTIRELRSLIVIFHRFGQRVYCTQKLFWVYRLGLGVLAAEGWVSTNPRVPAEAFFLALILESPPRTEYRVNTAICVCPRSLRHQTQLERATENKMAAWVQIASVQTPDSSVCVVIGTVHSRYGTLSGQIYPLRQGQRARRTQQRRRLFTYSVYFLWLLAGCTAVVARTRCVLLYQQHFSLSYGKSMLCCGALQVVLQQIASDLLVSCSVGVSMT